jgi:hypothetical protein
MNTTQINAAQDQCCSRSVLLKINAAQDRRFSSEPAVVNPYR